MTPEENRLSHILATALFIGMTVVVGLGLLMLSRLDANAKTDEIIALAEQISTLHNELEQSQLTLLETQRIVDDSALVFQVLADSNAAIIILDIKGRITLWSHGAELLFGYKREEVLGYGIAFLIPNHLWEAHRASYERFMNSDEIPFEQTRQVEALHKDGSLLPLNSNVWGVPGRQAIVMFTKIEQTHSLREE